MAKKFSVKSKSSIFKSLGLLALILFTFYFIYNYLATGSFSLKPRASEIVVNDAGLTSCSQLLTDVDCNRLKDRGCSWVVGPSTTKTVTSACEPADCSGNRYGCKMTYTTVNNPTTYTTFDCATGASISECRSGMYGCKVLYTDETKYRTVTKYTTTTTYTYSCSIGSTTSSGDCVRAGGSWIKTPHSVNTPYQVQEAYTVTHDSCSGTGTKSNPATTTVKESCVGTKSVLTTVPGVGSCTGTLKPLTPQLTPKSTPVVPGDPRVVNSTTTTPTPSSETCTSVGLSTGMTKCSTDGKSIQVCSGNNVLQTTSCSAGCGITNGVAKCKTETTKVIGCKAGDTTTVACTKPGYSKKGTCKSFAGIGIWRYSPCEKNSQRVKCETRIVSGGFQWRDPSSKDNKWSSTVKGEYCENIFYDTLNCVQSSGEAGKRLCIPVSPDVDSIWSNVGIFGNECNDYNGEYGSKSRDNFLSSYQNVKCLRDTDCINISGNYALTCDIDRKSGSVYGRCKQNDFRAFCMNVSSKENCDFYTGKVGTATVECRWNSNINKCDDYNGGFGYPKPN